MPLGSQANNVSSTSDLDGGLAHDVFVGKVVNNVRRESPAAMVFNDAQQGEYRLEGSTMKFAAKLRHAVGGGATDGKLPDAVPSNAVQGSLTPIRRYHRIAMDNLTAKRVTGSGSFEDLSDWLFDEFWEAWKNFEIRHAIGSSTGTLAKVSSRTSSTVVVLKDGFGHAGTNPIQHIEVGSILAWYDVSAAGIGGAAKVSAKDDSTNTITLDSATTWEPSATVAADDLILVATTNNINNGNFVSEYNLTPNGIGTILDPDAASSTVHGIAQGTYPRWKPVRRTMGTCDHLELSDFFAMLGAKRMLPVSPDTDVCVAHPGPIRQIGRSLMGLQQQAYTGGDLRGGHAKVFVDGVPLVEDGSFYHDVIAVLHTPALYRVNLGDEPSGLWAGDGSEWSRIADFDGKDGFAAEYMNFFSSMRGYHGALTGISTPDITESQYDAAVNNY